MEPCVFVTVELPASHVQATIAEEFSFTPAVVPTVKPEEVKALRP
jgi:hypothetical protein